ncbi:M20 metallopeptidase family protein [Clostridium saccharoperbutylacetonicum]|uniref:M20 metallopeptidase family protein n=1 Tax=Clostridium saccharoperbutylacetonicum TaxID=36745 RepID=UPI000983BC5F|nr:M20 family metallopeptidase [Clostridium saccharoperbutylacetonicum]AQR94066.1 putative hydrolase YxeP [Clostridium saccharoperbutylacetonicum]NSB29765.1 amidohydrolase [Clostridium saccharoperbutylacetonicum]
MSRNIREKVIKNYEYLIEVRKHFHMYPELSCQEYGTAAFIKKELEKFKVSYEVAGENSIVAIIKGNEEGKTLALRGDIDALPIQEDTGVEFASKNKGVMHACGHDCHAAFMLGAAKILNELKEYINGTVKIIFQEGEEIGVGARNLMSSGLLNDVDNIVGLHVSQELDLGKFTLGYGIQTSYGAGAKIKILGKGGEIVSSEKSVNALIVMGQIVTAINAAVAYEFPSDQQVVLVPTIIKARAETNVVPDTAEISYNFRTLNMINFDTLKRIIANIPQNIARAYGTDIDIELWGPGEAVNNEKESTDRAIRIIKDSFGEDSIFSSKPFMGGEDFSIYQKTIPGVFAHVGGAVDGVYRNLHTDKTLINEEVLRYGVEFLINYAFEYLSEHDKIS